MRARPRRTARIAEDCVRGSGGCTPAWPTTRTRWPSAPCGPNSRSPEPGARCFMESWPAPGASSTAAEGMDEAALAPLVAAGFEIVSVVSPAQALGRVVRARHVAAPSGTAVAALSLNSHGAAIAIVSGTEVIHSRLVRVVARDTIRRQAGGTLRTARSLPPRFTDCAAAPTRYRSRPAGAWRDGDLRHRLRQPARPAFDRDAPHRGDGHRSGNARLAGAARSGYRAGHARGCGRVASTGGGGCLAGREPRAGTRGKCAGVRDERATRGAVAETLLVGRASPEPRGSRCLCVLCQLVHDPGFRLVARASDLPNGIDHFLVAAAPLPAGNATGVPEPRRKPRPDAPMPSPASPPSVPASERRNGVPEPAAARPVAADRTHKAHLRAPLPTVDGIMIAGTQRLAIVGGIVVAPGDPVGTPRHCPYRAGRRRLARAVGTRDLRGDQAQKTSGPRFVRD